MRWQAEPRERGWVLPAFLAPIWAALGVGRLVSGEALSGWLYVALAAAWGLLGAWEWRRWRAHRDRSVPSDS
ncbi:hypothetical protein [Modestobacter sp. SYSU DS0511]